MNLSPHRKSIILEIHKVFLRPLDIPLRRNLLFKTAKHSKARDFSARQDTKATARLTPAVAFWCSIVGKDPLWSV